MNNDNLVKHVGDKAPTEAVCPANTSNAPDVKEQACSPATIQTSDPVVQCDDGVTFWLIQDKKDTQRNVWVSGVRGLCDTPEMAIKLARSCQECLEGEWNIIKFNTLEEWRNERTRQRLLH